MKILPSITLILILAFSVFSQWNLHVEGKISDLAGKTKVYLKADTIKSKERMEKVLKKESAFEIVSKQGAADFILEYKFISKSWLHRLSEIGEMSAYFFNSNGDRIVAWRSTKDKYKGSGQITVKTKENEESLTNEFIKAYKGIK